MARYIDADAVINKIKSLDSAYGEYGIGLEHGHKTAIMAIEEYCTCFPAPVKEVVRGEWLNFYGDYSIAECSKCAECYEVSPDSTPCEEWFVAFKQFYKFCPSCGANMRGEK